MVKIFIENAADLKIDLKIGKNVKSFFDIYIRGNSGLVKVFLENAATFGINLNDLEDICLNLAYFKGYSGMIKIFEEYPFLEEVCKNLERAKNYKKSSCNKKNIYYLKMEVKSLLVERKKEKKKILKGWKIVNVKIHHIKRKGMH